MLKPIEFSQIQEKMNYRPVACLYFSAWKPSLKKREYGFVATCQTTMIYAMRFSTLATDLMVSVAILAITKKVN